MQKESKHGLYQFPCGILERSVEQENLCSTQYGFNPVRQVILTTLLKICCLGCKASKQTKFYWRCCGFYCVLCDFGVIVQVTYFSSIYTETIKLCPLEVYVCQFLMYERISFFFLHYKLISFRNLMHLNEIHLITSRAADNSENTSTLKIKSHNINSLSVHHNSEEIKRIKT